MIQIRESALTIGYTDMTFLCYHGGVGEAIRACGGIQR